MTETETDDQYGPLRLRPTRRQTMMGGLAAVTAAGIAPLRAQEGSEGEEFSFDRLAERMKALAAEDYTPPEPIGGPVGDIDYDEYRLIQYRREAARWTGTGAPFVLHAYHMGWLFDTPVDMYEIVDGRARPLTFSPDDFEYLNQMADQVPESIPGVAGFRLNAPLNAPDRYDEVVSFLGASYFRALGKGNLYGLSARGLAINTATGSDEEFPRFSAFWLERPATGANDVVFYAALESASVTGAYRFVVTPGPVTTIDVTARLYFREGVRQMGIAPLTSMFLFGPNDRGEFQDYRLRVHDSEALIIQSGGQNYYRPLTNPPRLANSYIGVSGPTSFGLIQRHRAFDDYLDAHAQYHRRPSLTVEPVGNWGSGAIRLIEIPTELEANDNIVAFWVPEGDVSAGDEVETSYRLNWGDTPPGAVPEQAQVLRTLSGLGGVAGVTPDADRAKFVIDFDGSRMGELPDDIEVTPRVAVSGGEMVESVLERLDDEGIWRLVIEVTAGSGATVEMQADLMAGDDRLTETWLYQWNKT